MSKRLLKTSYLGLLLILPSIVYCNSNFNAAYLIDDQIISNYDLKQSKRLYDFLSETKTNSEIADIVINNKIQEIYANRININISDEEINTQIQEFLSSNNISLSKLKYLLNSKDIDFETFSNLLKSNIRWRKVLDYRFGYKINKLTFKNSLPLASTPQLIEKEYEFSEIFISFNQWDRKSARLIAERLEIELNAGADFAEAVDKFSAATSKKNKGKVGPVKKSKMPKAFIDILENLKNNEVSKPFDAGEGFLLLKRRKIKSYKKIKSPSFFVTYSIIKGLKNKEQACSIQYQDQIKGPLSLKKVKRPIREVLEKLMQGENYELDTNETITLCERFVKDGKDGVVSFENLQKNQEALRLSKALMLELRRNTTIVKK